MIELPEAETLRRDLEREVVGKRIREVTVNVAKTVRRSGNKTKFVKALDGAKITAVERVGLLLLLTLDNEVTVVVDLGSEGALRRTANKDEVEKKTAVIVEFTQKGQLRLVDTGGDAQMFSVPTEDLRDKVPEVSGLGLDPIAEPISWIQFGELILTSEAKLKSLLMDDSVIVGIGNLYSDEILFNAGLRYDRVTSSLSTQEFRRLYRALVETLHDAVKYRGTTLDERAYRDLFGEPGGYQEHLNVYRRAGELSPRSRRPIVKARYGRTWTYFCEQSQV